MKQVGKEKDIRSEDIIPEMAREFSETFSRKRVDGGSYPVRGR